MESNTIERALKAEIDTRIESKGVATSAKKKKKKKKIGKFKIQNNERHEMNNKYKCLVCQKGIK